MYWNGQLIQVLPWATVTFQKLGEVVIKFKLILLNLPWNTHEYITSSLFLADDITKEEKIMLVSTMNWLTWAVQDSLSAQYIL